MAKKRKTSDRRASKGLPNPIDVHVGTRVRMRRTIVGLSQSALAEKMGITFQQVQKYERGSNRISSSRLFDLVRILDVPISYFFSELVAEDAAVDPADRERRERLQRPETIELVRLYYAIRDQRIRHQFLDMVSAVAQSYPRRD